MAELALSTEAHHTHIETCVRVRPLNAMETQLENEEVWEVHSAEKTIIDAVGAQGHGEKGHGRGEHGHEYHYDHVFDQQSTNEQIYKDIGAPVVDSTLNGFNGTIFAYGQTSSGKTFTLMGSPIQPGLTPQAISDLFAKCSTKANTEFLVHISYIEIYNEQVRDLLNKSSPENLPIAEDKKTGPYVKGAVQQVVISADEALEVLVGGEQNRHFAATAMNDRSSRSHVCFTAFVESRTDSTLSGAKFSQAGKKGPDEHGVLLEKKEGVGATRVSRLNLVDLAGSERVTKAHTEGQRLKEGTNINLSLLTLGLVIKNLANISQAEQDPTHKHDPKTMHVPYRDSKLTRLLQNSLGGNSCTTVVCNISPASRNHEESKGTLQFATRCKHIVNKISVNVVGDKTSMMNQYKMEVEMLKNQLAHMEADSTSRISDPAAAKSEAEKKLSELVKVIIETSESGQMDQETMKNMAAVAQGKKSAEVVLNELIAKKSGMFVPKSTAKEADGRRMSSMQMNALGRISKMNESLVPKNMQIEFGALGSFDESEEDGNKLQRTASQKRGAAPGKGGEMLDEEDNDVLDVEERLDAIQDLPPKKKMDELRKVGEQQATYVAMLQLHMEALRELESKTNALKVLPHGERVKQLEALVDAQNKSIKNLKSQVWMYSNETIDPNEMVGHLLPDQGDDEFEEQDPDVESEEEATANGMADDADEDDERPQSAGRKSFLQRGIDYGKKKLGEFQDNEY